MSAPWYRGLTRTQWTVLLVAWLGWVFDIMDTALFNFAKVPMLKEMLGGDEAYKLRGPQIEGQIQTLFLIGWSIGGLFFGVLADRWGRTKTLIVTILLYSLLTGLTALCQTPEQVMVVRFLTALGIGGEWAAGAALVAETFPDRSRAPAAALLQSAAAFGPWLAALANLAIPATHWEWLFLVGVFPAFICVFIRMKVKEPEAIRPQPGEGAYPRPSPTTALIQQEAKGRVSDLFTNPRWRRNAIVAVVLGVVGVTGAGILPFWLPNLIEQAGAGLSAEAKKNFLSYNTFTLHIGTLLGVFAFPALAERIGRRKAFLAFFILAPAATALALVGGATFERLLLLLPVATFFSIGLSSGFVLYFPELFPSRLRATGAGLGYNVGRVVSAPVPALIGAIIGSSKGNVVAGVLIASCIYVFGLLALPFAPETKGKPLPEDEPVPAV